MTVQNLYTQYLEGKVTKQKFLYEVRRDQNLTMISPNNSFEDVVKILKNKSIISEKAHKESTGKQDVEIIAKTIDMVNPYEYSRGMNYELDIMDVPATSGDLSSDNMLKAQKKVLANLTKNPQYYCEKLHGKNDVSDEWVEVTKKEIDAIGKGKKAKSIIREGLGDAQYFKAITSADSAETPMNSALNAKKFLKNKFKDLSDSEAEYLSKEWAKRALDESAEITTEQLAIYEKYAQKFNKSVDEVKEMVAQKKKSNSTIEEGALQVDNIYSPNEILQATFYDDGRVGLTIHRKGGLLAGKSPYLQGASMEPQEFTYTYIKTELSKIGLNVDNNEIDQFLVKVNERLSEPLDTDELNEDVDLGHQDNEPHAIKAELYLIAKQASELYKIIDSVDNMGEIDFPSWWQAKITLSKNYLEGAKDYLEGALAVGNEEEELDEVGQVLDKTGNVVKLTPNKSSAQAFIASQTDPAVKSQLKAGGI